MRPLSPIILAILLLPALTSCNQEDETKSAKNSSEARTFPCSTKAIAFRKPDDNYSIRFFLTERKFKQALAAYREGQSKKERAEAAFVLAGHFASQHVDFDKSISDCWYETAADLGSKSSQRTLIIYYANQMTLESCKKAKEFANKYNVELDGNINISRQLDDCLGLR